MSPKTKGGLGIIAIIVGEYKLLNVILFGALALPPKISDSPESTAARVFAVTIVLAIGVTLVYCGNQYRKKAKTETASQGSGVITCILDYCHAERQQATELTCWIA